MSSTIFSASKSTSFYVVCPSNTNVEGNRTNSFRVRLPRKLHFHSQWTVGLAVLVYPHSWPSMGTVEEQYVEVEWTTGARARIPIPSSSLKTPNELVAALHAAMQQSSDQLSTQLTMHNKHWVEAHRDAEPIARRNTIHQFSLPSRGESDQAVAPVIEEIVMEETAAKQHYAHELAQLVAERLDKVGVSEVDRTLLDTVHQMGGTERWVSAYANPERYCRFHFDPERQRFRVKLDKEFVRHIEMSKQLAYMLGFVHPHLDEWTNWARYVPDMRGGLSSFFVYAPDLIEPVFIGDVAAPVLRMVNVRGEPDSIIEECYVAIQYHRLIKREFQEMFFELRTDTGALIPFQYGNCCLTLHFKKIPYF